MDKIDPLQVTRVCIGQPDCVLGTEKVNGFDFAGGVGFSGP